MKHTNRIIMERVYSKCSVEDVEDLIKYYQDNNEGFIDIGIKAERDYYDYPAGTFEVKFATSVEGRSHEWGDVCEACGNIMSIFLKKIDGASNEESS